MSFAAREWGNFMNLVFAGVGHLIATHRVVGNLIVSFDFILRRADSTLRDKSWRRQDLMQSKWKIPDSWRTGWKATACTSFALYLKVFKNHLYHLRHVRVLSIKPRVHTQLPEHNRSYWKVSWGWGHLITWNGPIMGHLNSFSASWGENLNKNFPKIQMPGGMFKLRFDWYIRATPYGKLKLYTFSIIFQRRTRSRLARSHTRLSKRRILARVTKSNSLCYVVFR